MFNKKRKKAYSEIDLKKLKSLKLFETLDGEYNQLGFNVAYMRIPGGVIRTIVHPEAMDQLFISLPNTFFIQNV